MPPDTTCPWHVTTHPGGDPEKTRAGMAGCSETASAALGLSQTRARRGWEVLICSAAWARKNIIMWGT